MIQKRYTQTYAGLLKISIVSNKSQLKTLNLSLVDTFRQTWLYFLKEAQLRAKNAHRFIEANNIYGDELWQKLTPKIKSEVSLASHILGLKGIVDQIEYHQDILIPVELKTGSSPKEGVWPCHKIQLAAYMLMLEESLNSPITTGYVFYLDSNQKREIKMDHFI